MASPSERDGDGDAVPCPCGLPSSYDACCGRFHRGAATAATAEQLMRSRYSAFATGDADYLRETWHPSTRPRRIHVDAADEWVRLDVVGTTAGGMLDDEGTVEFRAHHRRGGVDGEVHEVSRFVRVDRRWVYVGPADGPPR